MAYEFTQLLEGMAREKSPGPSATFSVFHALHALELIAQKPIGRNMLAQNLKIGEGAVRTMTSRLKEANLITTSKAGCALTKRGLGVLNEYRQVIKKTAFEKSELTNAECNWAILIKKHGRKLKSGMEQRDAAVIQGATNATTMIYKRQHLAIPSISNDVVRDFPKAAQQIVRSFKLEENDVVVIVGANNSETAEYGALAAAWTLLSNG